MEDKRVKIYDTTLRDGTQGEDVSFSVEDKLRIAHALDELGVAYIEGGWPGFEPARRGVLRGRAQREAYSTRSYTAFGSTRRRGVTAANDPNLQALLALRHAGRLHLRQELDLHVKEALGVSLEENLELIHDSVRTLKKHFDEVVYDAEHFFDGYADNAEYALSTLKSAARGGRRRRRPLRHQRRHACRARSRCGRARGGEGVAGVPLGIHAHNDREVAVANTMRRGRRGRAARAGHHQRFRRALRQRQPGLHHPQPAAQARLPLRAQGAARRS